jgi:hypothetical protein
MILPRLNDEEFDLLCLLKRRLFTPHEVIVDNFFNGSYNKASGLLDGLEKRKMVELIENRVIITAVGKKQLRKEQVTRGANIILISEFPV